MNYTDLKTDCRYFRGDVPCKPHKKTGVHCLENGKNCSYYDPIDRNILIIKLGAIGDVIRTTPLLHKLKEVYPHAKIFWLTLTPEVVPSIVDVVMDFSLKNFIALRAIDFKLIFNLDKDREACALMDQLLGHTKKGFILHNGVPAPIDSGAVHKYMTGVFDDINKANKKNYVEEIFELCGFEYNKEKYILDLPPEPPHKWKINSKKKVVGLNTGCGGRWTSRLWAEKNWIALAKILKQKGYEVILLGGEQEHSKNLKIARASGAKYFGHYSLTEFISLMNHCDLIVTGVTMALHLAIGLGKKIVLFNNIFNKYEFELYDNGIIIEPDKECQCFFQPVCTNEEYRCMEHLKVDRVAEECFSLLKRGR